MPSGAVHARDSRLLATAALISTPFVVATTGTVSPPLLVAAGCLSGIPLSPDLDHHSRTYAERYFVFGKLWGWFWLPYERLLTHRSLFSHGPLVGTLLRQLYLFTAVWLITYLAGLEKQDWLTNLVWLSSQRWYHWWLAGLLLSDITHWAQDVRPKWRWRRVRRRGPPFRDRW